MAGMGEFGRVDASMSYPSGEMFQVEVASRQGLGWVDVSEHSTLRAAVSSIEARRLSDVVRREYRIRRFVVAEIIDPPPATSCSCRVTPEYRQHDPRCLVHNRDPQPAGSGIGVSR